MKCRHSVTLRPLSPNPSFPDANVFCPRLSMKKNAPFASQEREGVSTMIGASGNFLAHFANGGRAACRLFAPNFAMMAGVTKECAREGEGVKNKPDVMSCFEIHRRGADARKRGRRGGCEERSLFLGKGGAEKTDIKVCHPRCQYVHKFDPSERAYYSAYANREETRSLPSFPPNLRPRK